MILAVGLFAMMGTFIASATSQYDQRIRTTATRTGNAFLEQQRTLGFAGLKERMEQRCPGTTSCTMAAEQLVNSNGHTYTMDARLTELDARSGSTTLVAGRPTVMEVVADVSWGQGSRTRTQRFTTAVAPVKPDLTRDIKSIVMFPDPTIVSPTSDADINPPGQPTQNVRITVELKGLPASTPVTVRWTDSQGPKGPYSLTSSDAKSWTVELPRSSIRQPIPPEENGSQVEFIVSANIGGGVILTQQQTLRLSRVAVPPVCRASPYSKIQADGQPVNVIPLWRSGGQKGRNKVPVTFTAQIDGLHADDGTALGSVTAFWQNGDWVSAPMTWEPSSWTWKRYIASNGQVFPTNVSTLTIYYYTQRTSDGATCYVGIPVTLS